MGNVIPKILDEIPGDVQEAQRSREHMDVHSDQAWDYRVVLEVDYRNTRFLVQSYFLLLSGYFVLIGGKDFTKSSTALICVK